MSEARNERYERIAVEEGFTTPEIAAERRKMMPPGQAPSAFQLETFARLLDLGEGRIAAMDGDGIAKQLCVLAGTVHQDWDPAAGAEIAARSNDLLADACRRHPDRLAGLAAFAPRGPERAAAELERAVKTLGLKGGIVNSHSAGEYLDDAKFSPIFAALEAMDVPLYIHPRDPSPQMIKPYEVTGFKVGWSWAAETGTHVIRLIGAGVFDRFPHLKIVIGHMGEGIPFHLDRIDNRFFWEHQIAGKPPKLARKPSDYVRDNVYVTTSGMNFAPPLLMTIQMLGIDNVLFAADYPFEVVRDSVAAIDALPIAERDKVKLYSGNAKRVFKL